MEYLGDPLCLEISSHTGTSMFCFAISNRRENLCFALKFCQIVKGQGTHFDIVPTAPLYASHDGGVGLASLGDVNTCYSSVVAWE